MHVVALSRELRRGATERKGRWTPTRRTCCPEDAVALAIKVTEATSKMTMAEEELKDAQAREQAKT